MNLNDYGWSEFFEKELQNYPDNLEPALISCQYSSYYDVFSKHGELRAELSGSISYKSKSREEIPTVGDWVLLQVLPDEKKAIIKHLLPRKSTFSRKAAVAREEEQVIAANIDILCIVSGLDEDFNPSRLERYITQAYNSGCSPLILLNKSDLIEDLSDFQMELESVLVGVPFIFLSTITGQGFDELRFILGKGKVTAFVGSSGVGKSSIVNTLLGEELLRVGDVRERDSKGRHTTTRKQLIQTQEGAIVIDTPGMREFALWLPTDALSESFTDIRELADNCKFNDCKHLSEPGCQIRRAIEEGELDEERYSDYEKLLRELKFSEEKQETRFHNNSKKRWKEISKKIRDMR